MTLCITALQKKLQLHHSFVLCRFNAQQIIINNCMKIKHVLRGAVDIQSFTLSIQVEWELLMGNIQVTRYQCLLDISESTHSTEYIQLL